MCAAPLFELGGHAQPTQLEIDERDGRPVLRVREGIGVTPGLVQAFNDVLEGEPGAEQAPALPIPPEAQPVAELRRRVDTALKVAYPAARLAADEYDDGDCQLGAALREVAEALDEADPVVVAVARELVGHTVPPVDQR